MIGFMIVGTDWFRRSASSLDDPVTRLDFFEFEI